MTTQNDWIKMSDQQPGDDQFPVWSTDDTGEVEFSRSAAFMTAIGATYWKPATLPAPPERERTQREQDDEQFLGFIQSNMRQPFPVCRDAWHAALAWERSQVTADMNSAESYIRDGLTCFRSDTLARLRARCGLK